jgi:hypothetical protein
MDREKKKAEKDSATCSAILTWYFNWAAGYLVNTKASVVAKRNEETLSMTLKSQWQDLVGRATPSSIALFADYKDKLRRLRKPIGDDEKKLDEMQRWDTAEEQAAIHALRQMTGAIELQWTCCALLSIVPSEAAVERTFSAQKFVANPLRNRMADDTVTAELTVRFNFGVFDQLPLPPIENVTEIDDEGESDADDDFLSVDADSPSGDTDANDHNNADDVDNTAAATAVSADQ